MESPARVDLHADRKVVFDRRITFVGEDFTGATFKMEVRLTPDAPGTALISLATVSAGSIGVGLQYAGSATVSAHISAGRLTNDIYNEVNPATGVAYAAGDTVTLSVLRIVIGITLMSSLPAAAEVGDDLELAYDLRIDTTSAADDKWMYGKFIVRGTVTAP